MPDDDAPDVRPRRGGREPRERSGKPAPFWLLVARFVKTYGYAAFDNDRWPTRDGLIPWRLFLLYCRALPRVELQQQLRDMHAVRLGYVSARVAKKDAFTLKHQIKRLERFASGEDLEDEKGGRARDQADDDDD